MSPTFIVLIIVRSLHVALHPPVNRLRRSHTPLYRFPQRISLLIWAPHHQGLRRLGVIYHLPCPCSEVPEAPRDAAEPGPTIPPWCCSSPVAGVPVENKNRLGCFHPRLLKSKIHGVNFELFNDGAKAYKTKVQHFSKVLMYVFRLQKRPPQPVYYCVLLGGSTPPMAATRPPWVHRV